MAYNDNYRKVIESWGIDWIAMKTLLRAFWFLFFLLGISDHWSDTQKYTRKIIVIILSILIKRVCRLDRKKHV